MEPERAELLSLLRLRETMTPSADRVGPEAGAREHCAEHAEFNERCEWCLRYEVQRLLESVKQAELAAASAIEFLLNRIQTHTCIECSLGHSERRKVGEQHEHGYHDALSEQWVFKGRCMSQVEWCRERIRELEAASSSKEERNG